MLWADRKRAVDAPRGPLRLSLCPSCGHVYNEAFVPELLDYSPAYENSLHHSPHFSGYAEDLARSLVERYALRGRFVVDVGCGRGDFLALVCRLGGNRGRGYDRSCPPDAAAIAEGLDVTFVAEFFSPTIALPPIDLLCCRQVLEHIADPAAFLAEIVASPAVTGDTILFFEVPNAAYTFEDDGIWDLIYEHCSYFTASSLVALFERCGLEVIATRKLYSGQYLGIEARPARDARAVRAGRLAPAETRGRPLRRALPHQAVPLAGCSRRMGRGRRADRDMGSGLEGRELPGRPAADPGRLCGRREPAQVGPLPSGQRRRGGRARVPVPSTAPTG